MFFKFFNKNNDTKSAKNRDKARLENNDTDSKQKKENKARGKAENKVKRTVLQTIPYEQFVSEYVMLLKSNAKIEKQTANLYSKSYIVPDTNYSSLPMSQKELKILAYVDLLNGFDSTASVQITLHNTKINRKDFEKRILLQYNNDGNDKHRDEFNGILHDRLMLGQNGIQCKLYITVTVAAIDFEVANNRFLNYEAHLNHCMKRLGTEMIPLKANERVRILCDIFRGVDTNLSFITRDEFARRSEKMLCCPEYFEFKKDYFMFNEKYARCLYFMKLPTSTVTDSVFKELVETNQSLIITKNIEFIDPAAAVELVRRQITNMKQEEIQKTRTAAERSRGAFVDPIEGTELAENKAQAHELLEDLQGRNQKMTLCQFIVMMTADSFEELEQNTEALRIIASKNQITLAAPAFRQEQALASVLPLGNSNSADKEKNLQVRRTLSSESTAIFCPFNSVELVHDGGLYYGVNQLTRGVILFNRRILNNPNGFIFGVPGAGKGVTAKLEIIYNILASNEEILILDPEGEYTALAHMFGGEVIYISENSATNINPLDLTENPDPTDTSYDPITAKLEFLLSFFSVILGVNEIDAIQKNIIDTIMRETYLNHKNEPTLKEYYAELEKYERENTGDIAKKATFLREALHLYVHGSMNVFAKKSNVNINKRIVVYNIKNLGKNMQTLGMMIVLENIWDRVAKNRSRNVGTRIYVDEMYLMFKSEQCANFFYELWKRARKWGGVPTGITQNVDDLLMSDKARTMLANTQFVLMLSQNPTDSERLSEILKIPPETMSYVTNSGVGRGLIYAGEYGNIPFDNRFPVTSNLYRIVSTAFAEKFDDEESEENNRG
jgi:hypothetical protein